MAQYSTRLSTRGIKLIRINLPDLCAYAVPLIEANMPEGLEEMFHDLTAHWIGGDSDSISVRYGRTWYGLRSHRSKKIEVVRSSRTPSGIITGVWLYHDSTISRIAESTVFVS